MAAPASGTPTPTLAPRTVPALPTDAEVLALLTRLRATRTATPEGLLDEQHPRRRHADALGVNSLRWSP